MQTGRNAKAKLASIAIALLAAVPAVGHHSFKAEYDDTHPVTVSGTVTKVFWKNPHVRLFVDAKGDDGRPVNWELQLASPNGLLRQGWKVDSLKPGDPVTVSGFRARDTARYLLDARKVTLGTSGKAGQPAR